MIFYNSRDARKWMIENPGKILLDSHGFRNKFDNENYLFSMFIHPNWRTECGCDGEAPFTTEDHQEPAEEQAKSRPRWVSCENEPTDSSDVFLRNVKSKQKGIGHVYGSWQIYVGPETVELPNPVDWEYLEEGE